jgi:biotin carboxylase
VTVLAAKASEALGLPHNAPDAVAAARNKYRMRTRLANSGLASPEFRLLSTGDDPRRAARESFYPCVLKPLALSAGRGVIRVDDPDAFVAAFHRIVKILEQPDAGAGGEEARHILAEGYIAGNEVALEGLLQAGRLTPLALFDKPDPMEGPYFEETIYLTPSRLAADVQDAITKATQRACAALGLEDGPIHAEMRINDGVPWVVEIAARSIGGLCARILRFGAGVTLEEIILSHALGLAVPSKEREGRAAGVMMIPVPRAGKLRQVRGLIGARAVAGIEEVTISIATGGELVPPPEGYKYLGFIFAKAETPQAVEQALRQAHGALDFDIVPL